MSDEPLSYAALAGADDPLTVMALDPADPDREIEVALTLTGATPHPQGQPGGSLVYTGPSVPGLGQGTYPVRCGSLAGPLFLVPIASSDETRTYQVIFA